jgi:hypothetical protein
VVEIVEQDMDANRRPIGPPRSVPANEHAKHLPDAADRRAESAQGGRPEGRSMRSLQGSGCKQVSIARVGRSFFGAVIYKYWQDKYFCWNYPKVTTTTVGVHVTNVDPFWFYRGTIQSSGWYYLWCCGNSSSGHYSIRQGKFENCVPNVGCPGKEYPWVKIWAHADGSYSYETGN